MSTPPAKPRLPVKPVRKAPEQPKNDPDIACNVAETLRPMIVPIESLKLDPDNARLHSEFQIAEIASSLATMGQLKPIVVNAKTRIVVAGNGMFAAAAKNGWTHIAAVMADPEKHDLKRFAIADNRLAELSEFDDDALLKAIADLPEDARLGLGWSEDELAKMLEVPIDSDSGAAANVVKPMADFPNPEANMVTTYQCPKCRYEWNGKPRS